MEADDERRTLIRIVRQRLEALGRAGVDRIPLPSATAIPQPGPIPRASAASPPIPAVVRPPTTAPTRLTSPSPPPPAPAPPKVAPVVAPIPARVERAATSPAVAASLFGEPELAAAVPEADRGPQLAVLAAEVAGCARCPLLAEARTQTVFGEGSATARLMFVGEAPGADEDRTGRPFVGRAGVLLTDMITKGMGLARDEVYIANVLKSRPPENRTPLADEIAHCLPYLERQVEIIRPQFLCLLGKTAASALLETALPLGRLRGKWHRYRGIPAIVT